ncbi:MAG: PEGA domain-containing protein [Phycisphaerae bacterium]|nr:PEGA domain-containing protein [Phycisphaerae bacterium]
MMGVAKISIGCILVLAMAGCVERTITITSEPSGALVEVSSVEIGRTPVTVPFTWYGDYEIILRREGCRTLETHEKIRPPIYEIPPLDLFSALAPWTYHDNRAFHYILPGQVLPSDAELIRRAEELRHRNLEEPE